MTKNEEAFVDQYTRKLMVKLCHGQMSSGDMYKEIDHLVEAPFLDYAKKKKWVNADGTKVLAAGWATAMRFLKR